MNSFEAMLFALTETISTAPDDMQKQLFEAVEEFKRRNRYVSAPTKKWLTAIEDAKQFSEEMAR